MVMDHNDGYGPKLGGDPDGDRFLRVLDDPWFRLVVRLQDLVVGATGAFWRQRGLLSAMLPVTTSSASSPMGLGSDSIPVEVEVGGVATTLADSMQFGLEYLCRVSPAGAWYLMPSFRGEPSDPTHLGQFFHSEVELPTDLDGAMHAAEAYLGHLVDAVLDEFSADLQRHGTGIAHLESWRNEAPARVSFDDAESMLSTVPGAIVRGEGGWRGLTRLGERALLDRVGRPVWVTNWDHLAVPFYQAFNGASQACNADLLLGLGEVVGLGQRHADGAGVRRALDLHKVDSAPYGWYVDLHDRRPMNTSGFGVGIERFLAWVLGHDDIRDLQVLPRVHGKELIP
jgi:asparaginyl-tRNA synthetase